MRKNNMSRTNIVRLVSLLLLALGTQPLSATVTYFVGSCKKGSFHTITEALNATPAPNVVKVCPGTYPEQVVITQSVTLEGISDNNSAEVIVASPPNGMVINATDDMGDPIAAQLYVDGDPISGFLVSGITFDANNNEASEGYVVGIFAQNAPGTIDHVVTRNQTGGDGGVGIWVEGGASNPSVTVENNSVHNFDDIGIWTQTNATSSELTATIKDNDVNGAGIGVIANADVQLGPGATTHASDNYLAGGNTGVIAVSGSGGAITNNTLITDGSAIAITGNVSATFNNIFMSSAQGILLNTGLLLPAIQHNTINECPIGIELNGNNDTNVLYNTITDSGVGLDQVPVGFAAGNSYFNVGTIMVNVAGGGVQKAARF
jgi:hypothetical protein